MALAMPVADNKLEVRPARAQRASIMGLAY